MVTYTRRQFKAGSSNTRAIDADEKEIRRQVLLDSGRALFEASSGELPTVVEIAKKAGLSKAAVYLYFKTKEELFLEVHSQMIKEWLERVAEAIDEVAEGGATIDDMVEILATRLNDDPSFMRLSVMTSAVLEKNVSTETLVEYKLKFANSLLPVVTAGMKVASNITPALMRNLIVQTYAVILGMWQMNASVDRFEEAAKSNPVISQFAVDIDKDLREALRLIWGQVFIEEPSRINGKKKPKAKSRKKQ